MRLFLALEIPTAVKDAVSARIGGEKHHLPATRWVQPVGLHLTLAFLGETAEELLPRLEGAVEEACSASPECLLAVVGAGTFPPKKPARVAWLGIQSGRSERRDLFALMRLQRTVEKAAFEAVEKKPDRRPFHPHLTLGRPRSPWPRQATEHFLAAFGGTYGDPFPVRQVQLVRSFLEPEGARYETLGEYALQATRDNDENEQGD